MKNKITLRSLISLSFLLFFLPFLKTCSDKGFHKVETVEILDVDSANTIINKNDTILAVTTPIETEPELSQKEENNAELITKKSEDASIVNFYELLMMTFGEEGLDNIILSDKTFYPLLGFLLVLISTIIMLVLSFFNKIKTVLILSVINLILLMISAILLYFCGVIESISQLRIGYYLIFFNYIFIIIISRKTLKGNRTV